MTKLVMIYKEFSYTSFNLIQQHTPSIVPQSHKRGLGRVEFYANLTPALAGREAVSNRPSAQ